MTALRDDEESGSQGMSGRMDTMRDSRSYAHLITTGKPRVVPAARVDTGGVRRRHLMSVAETENVMDRYFELMGRARRAYCPVGPKDAARASSVVARSFIAILRSRGVANRYNPYVCTLAL